MYTPCRPGYTQKWSCKTLIKFISGLLLVSGPQHVGNTKQAILGSHTTHQTYSNTSHHKRSFSGNETFHNRTITEHLAAHRSTVTHSMGEKHRIVPGVNLIDTTGAVYSNTLSSKCIATRTAPWFYIW